MKIRIAIAALGCTVLSGAARSPGSRASDPPPGPAIQVEDVTRFYQIYDAAGGRPTADRLQHDYIDRGSDGLHRFARLRRISGEAIAAALAAHPEIYSGARRCLAVLPAVRRRLEVALGNLARLYPEARFPPVTIAVGRGKPVGMTDSAGVLIGLEALCATNWLDPDVENRFVHVIAHEYGHIQQAPSVLDDEHPTVLEASLVEGVGELTAELISGGVAYSGFAAFTRGREKEIETAFVADQDRTDLSRWLYNGSSEKPGDLGYWVGYRIAKSYYQHGVDRRRAFAEILQMTDPKGFLARSGWYPGIRLD